MNEDIWFTSDTHFGHKNVQKFCTATRPGADVDEMDELMIQAWNSRVKPRARIYHTGDFSFRSQAKTLEILGRLNGDIHMILGNHDRGLNTAECRKRFTSVQDYKEIRIEDIKIKLMHFPIESWADKHRGAIHLHGHEHGGGSNGDSRLIHNRMDIGVDTRKECDMAPYHLDEILEIIKTY